MNGIGQNYYIVVQLLLHKRSCEDCKRRIYYNHSFKKKRVSRAVKNAGNNVQFKTLRLVAVARLSWPRRRLRCPTAQPVKADRSFPMHRSTVIICKSVKHVSEPSVY